MPRVDLVNELEQVIDKFPERTFSHTFTPSRVQVRLKHDNLWDGEIFGVNNAQPCQAPSFQDVARDLKLYGLMEVNLHELLSAARKELRLNGLLPRLLSRGIVGPFYPDIAV